MSAIEETTAVPTPTATETRITGEAPKRAREECEGEAPPATTTTATGRPVPPPLKFATSEANSQQQQGSEAGSPHPPAPMVRIKSRMNLSSPSTPGMSSAVAGLKINSPTVTPSGTSAPSAAGGLKILSPTGARSPGVASASGAPRFGSPTTTTSPKSPTRYSSFTTAASSASAAASQDPRTRYATLFKNTLAKDAGADADEVKRAADAIADALMRVPDSVRTDRIKSVLHHLADDRNKVLRTRIRAQDISGEELVTMDVKLLMNPEKQLEIQNKVMWAEKDRDLVELAAAQKISSAMYQCPKCKQRDCSFYEKQTRSADEPMTQFITCNLCKFKWKIG